ncbi:RNA-binding domain-containing protein [Candidatus Margulisiibacteriota bacterium]
MVIIYEHEVMNMEWSDFLEYLQKGDNETTQFVHTVEKEDDLGPLIAGFANNPDGGQIIIGLDVFNFHLLGTLIEKDWIKNLVKQNINSQVNLDIDSLNRNDKEIFFLKVPEGNKKPYTYKNKAYIRDGIITRIASLEEERNFQNPVAERPFDSAQGPCNPVAERSRGQREEEDESVELFEEVLEESIEESPIADDIQDNRDEVQTSLLDSDSFINTIDLKIEDKPTIEPVLETDEKPALNNRQEQAIKHVKNNQSIKNKEYRALFGVSHKTAHLELVELVSKGILVSQGSGRNTCYVLNKA